MLPGAFHQVSVQEDVDVWKTMLIEEFQDCC